MFLSACKHSTESTTQSTHSLSQGILPWPTTGKISSLFGMRNGRMHKGLDISADKGTPIRTVREGYVEFAGTMRGFGKTVIISHGSFKTLYAHCDTINVSKGKQVESRQTIATVGRTGNATGNHLHFEYRTEANASLDPLPFLVRR